MSERKKSGGGASGSGGSSTAESTRASLRELRLSSAASTLSTTRTKSTLKPSSTVPQCHRPTANAAATGPKASRSVKEKSESVRNLFWGVKVSETECQKCKVSY